MHDDQFTATGPSHPSSGKTKAAFSTVGPANQSDFEFGVHVNGRRFGVVGTSSKGQFPEHGIAGVYGNGSECKFGVLGTTMGPFGTIGVVGASVINTNDVNNLNVPSEEVELEVGGDGIGVLGLSGTGRGVSGRSVEGVGVLATSEAGVSLHAVSEKNRAGVFQAGQNVAQINLVPLLQGTREPQLPKQGDIGDLLLIRNTVTLGIQDECSLWLCVPGAGPVSGIAYWQEIKLGTPVAGTV